MSTTPKKITNLRQKQSLLYLLVFSLATVMVWVVISLISSQRRPGISPELQKLAVPLTPTLNQETLQKIERKQLFSESELARFPIYKVITSPNGIDEKIVTIETDEQAIFGLTPPSPSPVPSPSPSPSPTSTSSATIAPTSTQSAVPN